MTVGRYHLKAGLDSVWRLDAAACEVGFSFEAFAALVVVNLLLVNCAINFSSLGIDISSSMSRSSQKPSITPIARHSCGLPASWPHSRVASPIDLGLPEQSRTSGFIGSIALDAPVLLI
jgi:hypothetical protein